MGSDKRNEAPGSMVTWNLSRRSTISIPDPTPVLSPTSFNVSPTPNAGGFYPFFFFTNASTTTPEAIDRISMAIPTNVQGTVHLSFSTGLEYFFDSEHVGLRLLNSLEFAFVKGPFQHGSIVFSQSVNRRNPSKTLRNGKHLLRPVG